MVQTGERVIIQSSTPLPYPQFYIILFLRFIEPISFGLLFPLVYFMVNDFHLTDDVKQIGYHAGYIASYTALAEFLSDRPWGILSNLIGRKRVIMISLTGTMISMILFGLSKSYTWAIAARFMAGAFSYNESILKSMVGEMTQSNNKAKGFSYLTMSFGLGLIVGPSLGGFLSRPVENFPNIFGNSIFNPFLSKYPYFLPCGIVSFFCAISLIIVYFYPKEKFDNGSLLLMDEPNIENYGSVSSGDPEVTESKEETIIIMLAGLFAIIIQMFLLFLSFLLEKTFPLWAAVLIFKGSLLYDFQNIGLIITYAGLALILMQVIILWLCFILTPKLGFNPMVQWHY